MKMKRKKELLGAGFVSSYLVVCFRHHFFISSSIYFYFFGKSNFEGWLFSSQEHCTTHAIAIVESIHGVCQGDHFGSGSNKLQYRYVDGKLS